MNVDRAFEAFHGQIHSVLHKVLSHYTFGRVLQMANFMPLVDLFQNQTDIARSLLDAFCASNEQTSDPFIIHSMFDCAKTLHDSISATSLEDDRREVTALLCKFVHQLDFGLDLEKHLNFFVDCRQNFPNIDRVKGHIVGGVLSLTMKTRAIVKGKHSKKTQAFVKACMAYCFITIPSMDDIFSRLNLFVLSGQVALANQLVVQAEACFKAAITLIPEVTQYDEEDSQLTPNEPRLIEFIRNFLGVLVAAPGHPEHGPLYLVKALIKVVGDYEWDKNADSACQFYIQTISVLAAQYQEKLVYEFPGVTSNLQLFGGDPAFQEEILKVIDGLLGRVASYIEALPSSGTPSASRRQSNLALDVVNLILSSAKVTAKTTPLAVNLFRTAAQGSPDNGYLKNTKAHVLALRDSGRFHEELARKIEA